MKLSILIILVTSLLLVTACSSTETVVYTITQTQKEVFTITESYPVTTTEILTTTITATDAITTTPPPPLMPTFFPPLQPVTISTLLPLTAPPIPADLFQVTKDFSYNLTNQTSDYWYYTWQISIKNITDRQVTAYIEVHFLDINGRSWKWDYKIVEFDAQEEQIIQNEVMVVASAATYIESAIIYVDDYSQVRE